MPKRVSHLYYVVAAYLTLVILMAAMDSRTLFTVPGIFLFEHFHFASLYIPGLLFVGGLVLASGRFPRRTMLVAWISPIPFLTSAILLQVASGNSSVLIGKVLIESFGRVPSALLVLLVFALEMVFLVKAALHFTDTQDTLLTTEDIKEWLQNAIIFLGLANQGTEDIPASNDEQQTEDRPPMVFPSFPDIPEAPGSLGVRGTFDGSEAFDGPETSYVPDSLDSSGTFGGSGSFDSPEASYVPDSLDSSGTFGGSESFDGSETSYVPDSLDSSGTFGGSGTFDSPEASYVPDSLDSSGTFGGSESFDSPETSYVPDSLDSSGTFDGPEASYVPDSLDSSEASSSPGAIVEESDFEFRVQEAPEKPLSPDTPPMDNRVDDLIRRTLAKGQAVETESGNVPPPAPALPTAESVISPSSGLMAMSQEDVPEEDHDSIGISGKMDPQGTGPTGILTASMPTPPRRRKYELPIEGLLAVYPESSFESIDEETRRGGEILEETLREFKIEAKVTGIRKGPVITMYELLPSPGVKISSIVNLQDNIALRLAASRVRIVAPIPGKHAIGIEVPNKKRAIVSFSSMVDSQEFRESDAGIPIILGRDISGGNQVIDLTRTPHLLIAGATGSGKSVCVNSLIGSILYSRSPQEVKMIMVDPKIVELKLYNDIPHLLAPVITEPKRAIQALQWCLYEMERRYSLLDSQGVRDMNSYNRRVKERKLATESLPYIVVLVDEFADLMATSGKELEGIVARLAAMSRAVGIHLVLATQRPSVDVITGLIKANFPSRIAFMVAGKTDSRIIIDAMGAEKLLGRGDMLFTSAWDPFPSRMQGAFLAEEEVERMADYVKTLGEPDYIDDEMFFDEEEEEDFQLESMSGDDPMYEKALEIVVSSRKASASYLQRRLKIGYNRAARLVEEMERRGIVGPANGSKPRDLIHVPERFTAKGEAETAREQSSA